MAEKLAQETSFGTTITYSRSGEDEIYADLTTTSKVETCLNVLLARQ